MVQEGAGVLSQYSINTCRSPVEYPPGACTSKHAFDVAEVTLAVYNRRGEKSVTNSSTAWSRPR